MVAFVGALTDGIDSVLEEIQLLSLSQVGAGERSERSSVDTP